MKENTHGARAVVVATWIGIIVNTLLAIMKGIGGVLSGSKALIADALHSASDIVGSVVILLAVKVAHRPPDKEHPYGHGKAENIASLIVAILLILVGAEVSYSSVQIFFGERPVPPSKLALIIIIISIAIKEALFHYKYRLGKKHHSTALITEAWHHRSDSLSSLAALVGIGAAMLGAYLDIPFLVYGDALSGLAVSLIVVKVGYTLAKESSLIIMEKVLDDEESAPYIKAACSIEGVRRVDMIHARTHGSYIVIDLKLGIDPEINIEKGHNIGKKVKQHLMKEYPEIEDVLVHLNPYHQE